MLYFNFKVSPVVQSSDSTFGLYLSGANQNNIMDYPSLSIAICVYVSCIIIRILV